MRLLFVLIPTVALVVYGQLVVKWRVKDLLSVAPVDAGILDRLLSYLLDPFILSSYIAALLASITWMFVVERYPVSLAFPIHIGLTVSVVVISGIFLFGEEMNLKKLIGVALIVAGIVIGSRA